MRRVEPHDDAIAVDIAEIAEAARRLRAAEPSLADRTSMNVPAPQPRSPMIVWLMIGMNWATVTGITALSIDALSRYV